MAENITPAQAKAIENGGTNNVPVGTSLVKKGLAVDTRGTEYAEKSFRFVPVAVFAGWEKDYATAIEKEEDATPTSESAEIAFMKQDAERAEIEALREEFEDAEDERREEIVARLAVLGTVVYPEGSPQHTEYVTKLRVALAEWQGIDIPAKENVAKFVGSVHIDDVPGQSTSDAEVRLAEAIDADDSQAIAEILPQVDVIVRDPNEKRYAYVGSWTDENLFIKEEILSRRLARKTLLRGDREQAKRHLAAVKGEIEKRGL